MSTPSQKEHVTANTMRRADDQRSDGGLHAREDRLKKGGTDAMCDVKPGEGQHQGETREHEAKTGEQCADATARKHAEIHAQFMRFGTGQGLIHPIAVMVFRASS